MGKMTRRAREREAQPEPQGTPSIRTELRGCVVFTERGDGENAADLVIAHPLAGVEYVLPMDAEQNVALASLLVKGKPASALALLAKETAGIEIALEVPEPVEEGARS